MPKFNARERSQIKDLVALLSIKRIPDTEIIAEVKCQTNHSITKQTICNIRHRIKKESYHWYKTMREGQYEYIHEFKERINEILSLQKKHHQIIDANEDNPQIQQTSLAELHRLNITLSNYFDVAPSIINGIALPTTSETKAATTETKFIV